MSKVETASCPRCFDKNLTIEIRFQAIEGLLGGSSIKVPAREVPFLVCSSCELNLEGRIEAEQGTGEQYVVFNTEDVEPFEQRVQD